MKWLYTVLLLSLVALGPHAQAIAAENQHVTDAIRHAETAQIHGKAGHSTALLEHAQESLLQAQAAAKTLPASNQSISASIKHLEEAIAHAKQDHAEVATQHTTEALKHLHEAASAQ